MANDTEFIEWLSKGLVRPARVLMEHGSAAYSKALVHACAHSLKFDSCEDSRAMYLWQLLQLTGDTGFFRDRILSALHGWRDGSRLSDRIQRFELAGLFARQGDVEAKRALYDVLAENDFAQGDSDFSEVLVKLDGLEGLRFAAEQFLVSEQSPDPFTFMILVKALEERDGKESANRALAEAASKWPAFADALNAARAHEKDIERKNLERATRSRPDYADVRQQIITGQRTHFTSWGEKATPEELEAAADDLILETDEGRLISYLRIFQSRQFPRPPDCLFKLALGRNSRLAWAAIRALAHFGGSSVRSFAFELLRQPDRQSSAVMLLINNYQSGDYPTIEHLLREPASAVEYHDLAFAVLDFIDANPIADAEPSLKMVYERGPCSMCRTRAVKHLITLQSLPDWMRAECQYDADADTRALVQPLAT